MNDLLKAQLRLCQKAQVPNLNGDELEIYIPKGGVIIPDNVIEGGYYIIKLEPYIINPPEGFTLHINWNNSIAPKEGIMQCVVEKTMGKMVRINGIGYSLVNASYIDGTEWQGWLPQKSITVIKRLG